MAESQKKRTPELTASVQEKKGRLYAVIQYKPGGKRETKWRALGLPAGAQKSKINKAHRETVNRFEEELAAELERQSRPPADIPVYEYMASWLDTVRQNLQINTYTSYRSMIESRIQRYFSTRKHLTVETLSPKDIEAFYATIYADGAVGNTVIHYHAVLRKAFQQAYKNGLIDVNPFDRIDRPRKNNFKGENYTEEEWLTLLKLSKTDPIYPAIMLAGCLGLRRSEALGVRWSHIDWEAKTVLLDTKVVEYTENHKKIAQPVEEMKNRSSRRTLPLPPMVVEMLEEQKEKQALYRRMFKGDYNRKYDDYVCVNQLGGLMMPSYVTGRFSDLLEKLGLRHIRFHDLRHTAATNMHQPTGDFYAVGEILGHTLKGIGMSLGISTNLEAVTAQYVDVRIEQKRPSLKLTTKSYTHKKQLPKKERSKRKHRKKAKRKAAKWSYDGIFLFSSTLLFICF